MDSNQKGNVAELAFAKEAAALGLTVLKPMTEHERFDFVLGLGDRFLRVQCKWANRHGDVVTVHLTSSRRSPEGFQRRSYSAAEIDAIGIYCADLDECYLLPIDRVEGQWGVQLRLSPPRNGQRAALHFADDFRLGAVAQLEERCHGMAEVRGSSPLSSTRQATEESQFADVGAHEFRNHFGYYMERAASGQTILIRRRGRPFASLGPPDPPSVS